MSKPTQRKLVVRADTIATLERDQLAVIGSGFLQNPTQKPHSVFQGCATNQCPPTRT